VHVVKDEIESIVNAIEDLTEVVTNLRMPESPAPNITVSPPEVNVAGAVINVPERSPVAYEVVITSRDQKGNIQSLRMTPILTKGSNYGSTK